MLTVYKMDQAEQWDAVVRSFRDYDTYWLSGYVRAFSSTATGSLCCFTRRPAARAGSTW